MGEGRSAPAGDCIRRHGHQDIRFRHGSITEDGDDCGTEAAADEHTEQEERDFLTGQAVRASKRVLSRPGKAVPAGSVAAALPSVNLNLQ
jgi:hypothetical protein